MSKRNGCAYQCAGINYCDLSVGWKVVNDSELSIVRRGGNAGEMEEIVRKDAGPVNEWNSIGQVVNEWNNVVQATNEWNNVGQVTNEWNNVAQSVNEDNQKKTVIAELEQFLEKADGVILIDKSISVALAERLYSAVLQNTEKQFVILTEYDLPIASGRQRQICKKVPKKDMKILLDLYRSYEASDKLVCVSNSVCYGNIFNYVNTELITEKEMLAALLM